MLTLRQREIYKLLPLPSWATISTVEPNTEAWASDRSVRLGASEFPAVLGAPDAFETERDVWARKVGIDEGGKKLDRLRCGIGHAMEDVVADELSQRWGCEFVPGPWLLDGETPASGTPDLIGLFPSGRLVGVEVKSTYEGTAGDYADGLLPERTVIQPVIYGHLSGIEEWWVAVVTLGRYAPKLDLHQVEHRPGLGEQLRQIGNDWWNAHVVTGRPPSGARASDWATVATRHGLRPSRAATLAETVAVEQLMEARDTERLAKEAVTAAADRLARLTEGQPISGDGWRATPISRGGYTATVKPSTFYDVRRTGAQKG